MAGGRIGARGDDGVWGVRRAHRRQGSKRVQCPEPRETRNDCRCYGADPGYGRHVEGQLCAQERHVERVSPMRVRHCELAPARVRAKLLRVDRGLDEGAEYRLRGPEAGRGNGEGARLCVL